ncbi:MAG: hypothetical protein PVI86_05100 [Phycisphaerae bacterium]|jgi:hypothetical protein
MRVRKTLTYLLIVAGVTLAGWSAARAAEAGGAIGPDMIVGDLYAVLRFGRVDDITAYAVGTNVCNVGDQRVDYVSYTNQHPVVGQGMYRLRDDRFEQIGMSWLGHEFYAVNGNLCGPCDDLTHGDELGVGCSAPNSAFINGVQGNMSLRSDLDAHTGYFPYPWEAPGPQTLIDKRLQVHDADLDPDLNDGALYFVQGLYIAPDEAAAGNGNNNASYRQVIVSEDPDEENLFQLELTGETQREQPAIRAWRDVDPSVVETDVQVPGEGLFVVAAKATDLGGGMWGYSYAVQNLNSDRSGQSFSVPLPEGAVVQDPEFHGVAYHSGEVYGGTDWEVTVGADSITWSTDAYSVDPDANALRFDTVYRFYFETSVGPGTTTATLCLFRPGQPATVTADTTGPWWEEFDCNTNGIDDRCDTDCDFPGCVQPCGGSSDCNGNLVPDECEPDCNQNGVADACDIADCPPGELWCADCNANTIPDGCEPDCDGDGIPDDCDTFDDTDGDGVYDWFDRCSCTPVSCQCGPVGWCCWFEACIGDYPRDLCIAQHGVPQCVGTVCEDGCLIAYVDCNENGIADIRDIMCGPGAECDPPCGTSLDENHDGVPDECGCTADSDCDDGLFCNGEETCQDGVCMPGKYPCPRRCNEQRDKCVPRGRPFLIQPSRQP